MTCCLFHFQSTIAIHTWRNSVHIMIIYARRMGRALGSITATAWSGANNTIAAGALGFSTAAVSSMNISVASRTIVLLEGRLSNSIAKARGGLKSEWGRAAPPHSRRHHEPRRRETLGLGSGVHHRHKE